MRFPVFTLLGDAMRSTKSAIRVLMMAGLCAAAFGLGCSSTPEIGEGTPLESEFVEAPPWVVEGCHAYWDDDDELICGVGSASGSRNVSLMRTTAVGRGRTEIARTLGVQVKAMLKDYAATTTGGQEFGEAANDEQHIVDVSKQITDMSLAGTEQTASWISQTGTYYALVALDVEKFSDAVSRMDQLSESVRRAVVERAEDSFRELNEEVENERAR